MKTRFLLPEDQREKLNKFTATTICCNLQWRSTLNSRRLEGRLIYVRLFFFHNFKNTTFFAIPSHDNERYPLCTPICVLHPGQMCSCVLNWEKHSGIQHRQNSLEKQKELTTFSRNCFGHCCEHPQSQAASDDGAKAVAALHPGIHNLSALEASDLEGNCT